MKFLDDFYYHKLKPTFKREFQHVYIVDKSSLVDGRVPSFFNHLGFDNKIIVPHFVREELEEATKSKSFLEASKGKRGLLALRQLNQKLFENGKDLMVYNFKDKFGKDFPKAENAMAFVNKYRALCEQINGTCIIITTDSEFSKMLKAHQVGYINLNELANDLLDVIFVGEKYAVKLDGLGREEGQATGYINGRSLVVVHKGKNYLNKTVPIVVTNVLPTEHGKIVFANLQWE
jgi:uncharacterized protein YacL